MSNVGKVKAAQTRAKKLIEQYEMLGWEVKPSVKARAYMDVPKNITAKKAQAIIDNLSKQTINVTKKMTTPIIKSETEPIVSSTRKSGARIYDVVHMNAPEERRTEQAFNERTLVKQVMNQIRFVMENAPSRDVSQKIENRLWGIELRGSQIFNTNDQNARRAALLNSIISEDAISKSVKAAEKSGYPASQALTTLYQDLVEEYGTNERGLAARQMKQFYSVLESVGREYSTDPGERNIAADVLAWLIENASVWDGYRTQFKLKKIYHQTYDSNSLLTDVSDVLVDHPQYKMLMLEKLIDLMKSGTAPWDILDSLEKFAEELENDQED